MAAYAAKNRSIQSFFEPLVFPVYKLSEYAGFCRLAVFFGDLLDFFKLVVYLDVQLDGNCDLSLSGLFVSLRAWAFWHVIVLPFVTFMFSYA